jgi:hypothetical protein
LAVLGIPLRLWDARAGWVGFLGERGDLVMHRLFPYNKSKSPERSRLMRKSLCLALLLFFVLSLFSTTLVLCAERGLYGAGSTSWNTWRDRDNRSLVMKKANFSVLTAMSLYDNNTIDNYASTCKANNLEIVGFTDKSVAHNLRSWLLTKTESLNDSAYDTSTGRLFVALPGLEWNGNADEPAVGVFGTRTFVTSSENPAAIGQTPLIMNNNFNSITASYYLSQVTLGNHPMDSKLKTDLEMMPQIWQAVEPNLPPDMLTPKKIGAMDFRFNSNDDANKYDIMYRTKGKKTISDLSGWLSGETAPLCQFNAPGTVGTDATYYKKKKDDNPGLVDKITACNASRIGGNPPQLSIFENDYRYALCGGWKVAPTFCSHNATYTDFALTLTHGYTGTWLHDTVVTKFPATAPPQAGTEDNVINAVRGLMTDVGTGHRTYVSTMFNAPQDSALKLEMTDLHGNRIGSMGDSVSYGNAIRAELSVDYQYNTPVKDRMILESACLVVIYKYGSSAVSRELPFMGIHTPLRNYLFTAHRDREIKNRTFSLVLDDLSQIQAIYGKVSYRMPDATTDPVMQKAQDFYVVQRRAGAAHSYNAISAPIWLN